MRRRIPKNFLPLKLLGHFMSVLWKSDWSGHLRALYEISFWYQRFEHPTIHMTVATFPKFWGLKFQNGLTHAELRGRVLIFRYCLVIRTCSFTWTGQNKFSTTLQISGFWFEIFSSLFRSKNFFSVEKFFFPDLGSRYL